VPILDTNVFIRFLTRDNADQSPRAAALFRALEAGERSVFVPEAVVAEVVYVLASPTLYAHSRDAIRDELGDLLHMPTIEVPNKVLCMDALNIFADNPRLSFIDALCAAHGLRLRDNTVISFDRDYKNIEGLTREEP
jgi:predicted nucleic acid-binding protein